VTRRLALALLVLVGAPLAACGGKAGGERVVVLAAASLRDAFGVIAQGFEADHPGVDVVFDFAGSQELRTRIEAGAPFDVFASADQRHMDALVAGGHVAAPRAFAHNHLVLVVAKEAAQRVRTLADLPSAGRVVIGAPEVPVGRYTLALLDRAGASLGADFRARVEARVVSRELNVRQVLAKVRLGEADAGVVYRSDAWSARGEVVVVEVPAALDVVAEYPIGLAARPVQPELAAAWVEAVLSERGRRALAEAGFVITPPAPP